MEKDFNFKLVLNSKIFKIPFHFNNIIHISQAIYYSFILNHEYHVKTKANESIFQSFIDYLIEDKEPKIEENNVDKYKQLNEEFQFRQMDDLIEMYEKFNDPLYFLDDIEKASAQNQILIEEKIAQNIEKCVRSYNIKMKLLSVDRLYRIFTHPKRHIEDHNVLYEFICFYFSQKQNKEIFKLLPTLNASKLTKKYLDDSISLFVKHGCQLPQIDIPDFFEKYDKIFKYLTTDNKSKNIEGTEDLLYQACVERDEEMVKWLTREEFNDKDLFSYKIDKNNKTAAVFRYLDKNVNAFIPKFIDYENDKYLITTILTDPKNTKKIIQTINFDENSEIQKIGKKAFFESSLQRISIPSSVKIIENSAFDNCEDLSIVDFSDDSELEIIENKAFTFSGVKKICIPSKTVIIDEEAFDGCKSLVNLEFCKNSSLEIIGKSAFCGCEFENVNIPSSVRIIKEYAFESFDSDTLKSIVIEGNSKSITIEFSAFSHSTEKLTFSSSLIYDDSLFWCMKELTEINIPKIENFQFKYDGGILYEKTNFTNCHDNYDKLLFVPKSIKKVTIPSNVKIIAKGALSNLETEKIFIPSGVVKIEELGFESSNIEKVEFDINTKFISIDGYAFDYSSIKTISLPSGEIEFKTFWCHETNELTEIKVPESNNQLKFENGILYGKSDNKSDNFDLIIFAARNIEIVNIPSNIKIILSCAFYRCKKIKTINFSKRSQLISIKESVFNYSSIKNISIPDSVSEIKEHAFYSCTKLKSINFNEKSNLQSVSRSLFSYSNIEKIKIPKHVKEIGIWTFAFCNKLKYVEIPENSELHSIYDYAFYKSSIESIFIPSQVTFIDKNAFKECDKLKIVEISEQSELKTFDASVFLNKSFEILFVPAKLKIFINI